MRGPGPRPGLGDDSGAGSRRRTAAGAESFRVSRGAATGARRDEGQRISFGVTSFRSWSSTVIAASVPSVLTADVPRISRLMSSTRASATWLAATDSSP